MTASAGIPYQPAVLQLNLIRGRVWLANEIRPGVVSGSPCQTKGGILRVMKYDEEVLLVLSTWTEPY